ncbi:MAG: hypothetical protein JWO44_1067 [Bacteroidetes bacterium]|nr:hypothetical protein [Bacteroidota bacterium]
MESYKQLLGYINKNYKNFIFVALFYSLWLACKYAQAFDPSLQAFPGRMIGEATLNAYDIGKRIHVFYYSGLIFFFSMAAFSFINWRISLLSSHFLSSAEAQIINYTSLAGITFYFFGLWTKSFDSSFELIYCIQKAALTGFALKWLLLKNKPQSKELSVSFYAIAFVLGFSVFFLLNEFAVLSGWFPTLDLLVTLFISVVLLLLFAVFKVKNKTGLESCQWLNRLFFLLIPLAVIPVLSFFKDEVYLILNRHEVYYLSPRKLYLFFLLCVAVIIFLRYKKLQKGTIAVLKNNGQLVALRYLPLLVISLTTYTFYSPFVELSNEMFESGNRFLPLMEFSKFGVVPIFEKFNSHVLSELFFGGLYAFFNGMHSREMYIYEFFYQVFWAFMVYSFMYRLSRNAYAALFLVLLFPLMDTLLSDYVIISLLAIFMCDKVLREPASFKNYFLLISCFTFLVLWRIDIGYPAAVAGCAVLLVYRISREQFVISWKILFKALAVLLGGMLALLLAIGWYRDINVFEKLWSGLNYLASAQTYGLTSFGDASKVQYQVQYFVFPLVMLLGLGGMLVFFKKLNITRSQRFIYAAFLFMIVYYFVNFQRGLVRHSFIEGHDNGLSSFAFFIFSGSVFLLCYKHSGVSRLVAFVVLATFLLMNYKFPVMTDFQNLYSKTAEKTKTFSAIEPKPGIVRCIDTSNFEETHFGDFKRLIATHLTEKQTFIDFSNLPMLYYFTGKISPSYFYQNPLTIHNEYLQKKFISGLSQYDAPLIVFSNFPENWWDNVDGVPNTMRHYRLAEYFYQHYEPFVIVNNLCVWKKTDFKPEWKENFIFQYTKTRDSLEALPERISFRGTRKEGKKYSCYICSDNGVPEIKLATKAGSRMIKADLVNPANHMSFYILPDEGAEYSVEIANNKSIRWLTINEADYINDFYSFYPQTDDLKQLPYIWGNYDDSLSAEKMLADLSPASFSLLENNIKYFNFNKAIDKTSGNTIFLSLEAGNEEPQLIELLYGSSENGYKGAYKFTVPPGSGERSFAVRISSQYNWYDPSVDYIALVSRSAKAITVKKLQLLKAQ